MSFAKCKERWPSVAYLDGCAPWISMSILKCWGRSFFKFRKLLPINAMSVTYSSARNAAQVLPISKCADRGYQVAGITLLFGQVWGGIEVGEGGWGLGVPFLCWRILFPLLKKERLITPQCRTPLTSAKVTSTQFSKYSHKIIYYLIFAKKNLNHKKIPKMKK